MSELKGVHKTVDGVETIELTPPHPPRKSTPEYRKAHEFLVNKQDSPCKVCGVRKSTLSTNNPFHAKDLETHHYPIERSLMDACDPAKVHLDFPVVYDQKTLEVFIDSPANLMVLCDIHHRSTKHGIHHLPVQDFVVQKYLYDGYIVATNPKDAEADLTADDKIEKAQGLE